jgi:cytochrome c oxidase subunit 3
VSEAVLEHPYIPEDHAPDPVTSHGDPTPPGKVGIWLFLASEIMFFVAILGTYVILRSGSPEVFAKFSGALSKTWGAANTIILIFSSLTMALAVDASQKGNRKRTAVCLLLTFLCAAAFLFIKIRVEYHDKWYHHTVVYRDAPLSPTASPTVSPILWAVDGHEDVAKSNDTLLVIRGARMQIAPHSGFDIHMVGEPDLESHPVGSSQPAETDQEIDIPRMNIVQDMNYMPYKNIFFACYFTLTAVHGIHVLGGMIPLFFLMVQAMRGKLFPGHTEYVGLYWHFVDLIWIFLFPLLYLI